MLQPASRAIVIMATVLSLGATSANLTSGLSPVLIEHKCSECIKEGRTSKVYIGGCMATLAACGSSGYYDEAGVYRPPSPCNTTSCSWECSNGHKGTTSWASY